MGKCITKMRSTFFCIPCQKGFMGFSKVKLSTLYGIPHFYQECADKGFNAQAFVCPSCSTPLVTKLKHLIREQQFAFKRHNAKRKVKNGTTEKA